MTSGMVMCLTTFSNISKMDQDREYVSKGSFHGIGEGTEKYSTTKNNTTQDLANQNAVHSHDPLKVILMWNSHFNQADFGIKFGSRNFERTGCSKTCFVTSDKSLLSSADAVVLHTFSMGTPVVVPPPGRPLQVFVFVNFESPTRSWNGLALSEEHMRNRFNLTMTYMTDSGTDIQAPMGVITPVDPPDMNAVPTLDVLRAKSKSVLWVVSNCESESSRSEYAQELAKHITVDIYGECGIEPCPYPRRECFDVKGKHYMFYLAFENSFCQDYVTEKAYRTLTYDMVPVVLGYANYSRVMPPGSYIDVRDFDSPKALAKYLLYLEKHRAEYRKYFLWKSHSQVYTKWWHRGVGFCRLCEILNTDNYSYKQGIDVVHYWNPQRLCLGGKQERTAVHLL